MPALAPPAGRARPARAALAWRQERAREGLRLPDEEILDMLAPRPPNLITR
jgi:hypothetical protein